MRNKTYIKSDYEVVHVITSLDTGGAEKMLIRLARCENSDNRYTHSIISLSKLKNNKKYLLDNNFKIYEFNLKKNVYSLIVNLYLIFNLINKINPSLVIGWMYHSCLIVSVINFFLKRKIFVLWNIRHTPVQLKDEKFITRFIIYLQIFFSKFVNGIIYNSMKSKKFHEYLGFKSKNSIMIPNGFQVDKKLNKHHKKTQLKTKLNLNKEDFVFGHVGRFHPMKNHKLFIEMAQIISQKTSNVKFVMVGRDINLENSSLKNLIQELGLEKKFILLDEQQNMDDIYKIINILCVTSKWGESFPNVIAEAMLNGVPCVTTNIGDAELIVGKKGKVVKKINKYEFSTYCMKLLEELKSSKNNLILDTRNHIIKNYNINKIIKDYENFFDKIRGINI